MFKRPKKIIFIGRDKMVATEVVDVATKKFGLSHEVGWTYATLDIAFTEIAKKFNSTDFRLLLGDDLAYIVRLEVPNTVAQENVRGFVLTELQKKVPDDIEEGEWDYRELRERAGEGSDVIAYVLEKKFAKSLANALAKTGLNFEAIEPEIISKTRDSNAYIGLALKEDIQGKDEDVLNIKPSPSPKADVVASDTPEEPHAPVPVLVSRQFSFKLLLVFMIPAVLIGILVGGLFYLSKINLSPSSQKAPAPPPSSSDSGNTDAEQTISAEEAKNKIAGLSIQILNGSGVPGEASKVSSLLEYEGFTNFKTANASSFDFADTEVKTKEGVDSVFVVIERALKEKYSVVRGQDFLPDTSDFDVVITVGKKK